MNQKNDLHFHMIGAIFSAKNFSKGAWCMGRSLWLGMLLGAIVLFIWMGISWMALPWHCSTLKKFSDENSVAAIFRANAPESGIYVLPNMCGEDRNSEAHKQAAEKGPIVFSAVRSHGYNFMSPKPYIIAFIIFLISSLFVTWLLLQRKETTYWRRVAFVTAFGIACGVLAFMNWNWWGFNFSYVFVEFIDSIIGWFLAGLVIAAVARPRSA